MYYQLAFAIDRAEAMVAKNPELAANSVLNAAASNDTKALAASGEKGLLALLALTHAGNTTEEFATIVKDWLASARHPKSGHPHTELVFQPMRASATGWS